MNKSIQSSNTINGLLTKYRGCLAVVFDDINVNKINDFIKQSNTISTLMSEKSIETKNKRNIDYHITVFNPLETKSLNDEMTEEILNEENIPINIAIGGFGINANSNANSNCYYLICISKELDNLRLKYGQNQITDYHITLGFDSVDCHDISKSFETMHCTTFNEIDLVISNMSQHIQKNIKLLTELYNKQLSEKILPDQSYYKLVRNLINQYCVAGDYSRALAYTHELIQLNPTNIIGYYMQFKILDHVHATIPNTINSETINQFINILLGLNDIKQLVVKELIELLNKHIIKNHTDPNKTVEILFFDEQINKINIKELPPNFSNIDNDFEVFGSGIVSARHIQLLKSFDINTIINLIGEEKPKESVL